MHTFALEGTSIDLLTHKSHLLLQQASTAVGRALPCLPDIYQNPWQVQSARHTCKYALKSRVSLKVSFRCLCRGLPRSSWQAARTSVEMSPAGPAPSHRPQDAAGAVLQIRAGARRWAARPGESQYMGLCPANYWSSVSHSAQKCVNKCQNWPEMTWPGMKTKGCSPTYVVPLEHSECHL